MPIQIRELIVTATIEQAGEAKSPPVTPMVVNSTNSDVKLEIIQACVDEVLKVLKQDKRR